MSQMRARSVAIGTVVVLIGGYFGGQFVWYSGWLIDVPRDRDPALVGTWNGARDTGANQKTITVRFSSDGTARVTDWGPVQWGTQDGILHLKFRSAGEGWNHCRSTYSVDRNHRIVLSKGLPWTIVPSEITRS